MGCHANQDSICFEAFNITLSRRIELPGQSGVWEAHRFGPLSLARDPGADRDHDHRERHLVIRVPAGKWRDLEQG